MSRNRDQNQEGLCSKWVETQGRLRKAIEMRRVLLNSLGEFALREVPWPKVQKGEALVRVGRVGVCGSDFHAFAGQHPAYTYPRVLGHELVGEVIEDKSDNGFYEPVGRFPGIVEDEPPLRLLVKDYPGFTSPRSDEQGYNVGYLKNLHLDGGKCTNGGR